MWKSTAAGLIAAALIAGCAAPSPTRTPEPHDASPSPSTATTTATPSPQPTPTPVPTPAPTLRIQDIDIFFGGTENWEMATTETNVNGIAEIAVLRPVTETVEIYADCVGDGQLAVTVTATPPAQSPPPAVPPSPYTMTSFEIECPDAQSVSFGGAAPAGWFVSPGGAPSDPSVRYQILVATAKQ